VRALSKAAALRAPCSVVAARLNLRDPNFATRRAVCVHVYSLLRRRIRWRDKARIWISLLLVAAAPSVFYAQSAGPTALPNPTSSRPISKPPLDTVAFQTWSAVGNAAISNDGAYVSYHIYDSPVERRSTLVVQARQSRWKLHVPGAKRAAFTDDSRRAVVLDARDSLCLVTLGSGRMECIAAVQSFQLFQHERAEWLAWQDKDSTQTLVLRNLANGAEQSFANVTEYVVSRDGSTVLVKTKLRAAGPETVFLHRVTLPTLSHTVIWRGPPVGKVVLNMSGTHVAFIVEQRNDGDLANSVWYYKAGTIGPVLIADGHSLTVDPVDDISAFSSDDRSLFVKLKARPDIQTSTPSGVLVDIWSYIDPKLQSQQLSELSSGASIFAPTSYLAVIDLELRQMIRLQREHEEIWPSLWSLRPRNDVGVVTRRHGGDEVEWYWNSASRPSFALLSTQTGERQPLPIAYPYQISPGGRYLVGTDTIAPHLQSNLLSYELATRQSRDITRSIRVPSEQMSEVVAWSSLRHRGLDILGWLDGDSAVLVQDGFDVWRVDPLAERLPINLTNGYGRRHNIVFELVRPSGSAAKPIGTNDRLILRAFHRPTKASGFYAMAVGKVEDPKRLAMGPYRYGDAEPLRARDAEVYLVQRESAVESPNFFWTVDFKDFQPISAVYPERAYNWLTAELLAFQTLDGRSAQGVLYRPENFNPSNRYPLILHYYETLSSGLNEYKRPEAMDGPLDIPWFVSRGYLVFTPDIEYTLGLPGPSAYAAVVGAAQFLARFRWIDTTKIGIQGHSWGGYQTNYLVTRTNLFAAAMASAGMSDLASGYGSLIRSSGVSKQYFYEVHQTRIGAPPWERPELYVEQSPVFRADQVVTPLLMMNNKDDGIVPFSQGIEFFTALRRLGKRVWMLQYDGEPHSLLNDTAKLDYTVRMTQFFDHYLRGAAAPRWMTRGIPASLKGVETGLDADDCLKTPGPGLSGGEDAGRREDDVGTLCDVSRISCPQPMSLGIAPRAMTRRCVR
jgi:dienelactone hydrolase